LSSADILRSSVGSLQMRSPHFLEQKTRDGGEDKTFEAKAKDSEKVRGQGQGTELLRTGCLEAKDRKARGQGQGLEDIFENTRKYKCKHCNQGCNQDFAKMKIF